MKKYKLIFNYKDPYVKKFLIVMIPTLIGIFGYQINELVDTSFAGALPIGTISAINYASRLYLLPVGVFAVSLSVVIFPSLSRAVVKKDNELFKNTIQKGLHFLAILIIPSSLGLIYYSKEIIMLLFNYGKFDEKSVQITSEILQFYALGLIFFSSIHLLTRAHYAQKDRKLPVISSFIGIGLNILLDYLLYKEYAHRGLTFATSFSAMVNFIILFTSLNKRYIKIDVLKYMKFILIALLDSLVCIFIIENMVNITNPRLEIIVKLLLFIAIYFSIFSLKYLKDKRMF
jgi:integral membrane protein mviN